MAIRAFIRGILRQNCVPVGTQATAISHPDLVAGFSQAQSIHASARLTVVDPEVGNLPRISLSRGAYIGREVELTAAQGGSVEIGFDTSLQDGCNISGSVKIGSHCLFGKYVFVGSTRHRFRDRPTWLIRDQDRFIHDRLYEGVAAPVDAVNAPIVIEDDCWIGQGVVIQPGVYVGRGAIIGANTVVTTHVGPYEIHGGLPNKAIGMRHKFVPPNLISADRDDSIPYFYRGFKLGQSDLSDSRLKGVVASRGKSCIVLSGGSGVVTLEGTLFNAEGLMLRIEINGQPCGTQEISSERFSQSFGIPKLHDKNPAPSVLRDFTVIELATECASEVALFGISRAAIE